MKRSLCLLLLSAVLLLSGCSSMFDREIYVVEEYEVPAEAPEAEEDSASAISNYAALRRAISRLVSEHTESAQLQFQNYEGSISQDISTACWEVKSSTAMGAFAVDYISYDLSRIVSYYQAEIYITYKRTAWQVTAVESAANIRALAARLSEALEAGETYLAVELNAAAVSGGTVREAIEEAYYGDPLLCPVLPSVETNIFPESGVTHILEINLDYGMDPEALAQRRDELSQGLTALLEDLPEEDAGEAALLEALCEKLREACEIAPDTGRTAWDALWERTADSEGAAMALEAACLSREILCVTVEGRLDGEPHCWNIVSFAGGSYHIDVTGEEVFLLGDESMLSDGYWWDNSEYPVCAAAYTETTPSDELSSGEPAEEA